MQFIIYHLLSYIMIKITVIKSLHKTLKGRIVLIVLFHKWSKKLELNKVETLLGVFGIWDI